MRFMSVGRQTVRLFVRRNRMASKERQQWSITKVAPDRFIVRTLRETEQEIHSTKEVMSSLSSARRAVARWEKEQDA